jgi:hypothetical protein
MDELVKDSVPVEEKNPLMESAWATATLLRARAAITTKRLYIKKVLREVQFYVRGMSSHWWEHLSCQFVWMKFSVNRTERKLIYFSVPGNPQCANYFLHRFVVAPGCGLDCLLHERPRTLIICVGHPLAMTRSSHEGVLYD